MMVILSSKLSRDSEANASESLDNLEAMFHMPSI